MPVFNMIVQQTHRVDPADTSFPANAHVPAQSHVAEIAAAAELARGAITDQSREHSGRKLRNRILMLNAVAWVAIIVAVRMIFF
jgi:hypothetical protein